MFIVSYLFFLFLGNKAVKRKEGWDKIQKMKIYDDVYIFYGIVKPIMNAYRMMQIVMPLSHGASQ